MDRVLRIILMKVKTQDDSENYLKVLNFHGYARDFIKNLLQIQIFDK